MVMELQNSTLGIFGMAGFAHQQPQATPLINSGVKRVGACVSFCTSTHDIILFFVASKKKHYGYSCFTRALSSAFACTHADIKNQVKNQCQAVGRV